jgi:hypothetical protein
VSSLQLLQCVRTRGKSGRMSGCKCRATRRTGRATGAIASMPTPSTRAHAFVARQGVMMSTIVPGVQSCRRKPPDCNLLPGVIMHAMRRVICSSRVLTNSTAVRYACSGSTGVSNEAFYFLKKKRERENWINIENVPVGSTLLYTIDSIEMFPAFALAYLQVLFW